jgi:hypothetical protein
MTAAFGAGDATKRLNTPSPVISVDLGDVARFHLPS